jgi:hypothetical protein
MRLLPGLFLVLALSATPAVARADDASGVPAPAPSASPAPAKDDWSAVPTIGLRQAIAEQKVDASGTEPRSYTAVKLHLANKTAQRLAVDLGGSYLEPRGRNCQRLALGPPAVTPSTVRRGEGTSVVLLEPGKSADFVVNTCCMDAGLPAPTTQRFEPASAPMPAVREKVMRWWIDNPTAPQDAVNCAIWQNSPTVQVGADGKETRSAPKGRTTAIHGGAYYRLVDGELTCLDEQGLLRILATRVDQVLPTDSGVYAVMPGDDGHEKLWRLAVTGEERWSRVMDLDGVGSIHALYEGGKGNLAFLTDDGLVFWDASKAAVSRVLNDDVCRDPSVFAADGRLLVAFKRPPRAPIFQNGQTRYEQTSVFSVWSLAMDTGKSEQVEQYWNIDAIRAGAGGVFALTPTEHRLRRLAGDKFVDVGPQSAAYRRIVGVSRATVWLADLDGRLVAVEAKTGRPRLKTDLAADDLKVFAVDPRTGDIAYVVGEEFRWLHAADGHQEGVVPR